MPVAKLKKAVLYYHNSIQTEVLHVIQKSGVCEIIPANDENDQMTVAALEAKTKAVSRVTQYDAKLADLRYMLRSLEPHYRDTVSGIARALGERPSNSFSELADLAAGCNVTEILETVRNYERKLSSIRMELSKLDSIKAVLVNFLGFPYPINTLNSDSDSKGRLRAIAGNLPFVQSETWKNTLLDKIGKDCEIYLAPHKEKQRNIWAVVMYASERESEVAEICSKNSFTESKFDFVKDDDDGKVTEKIASIQSKQYQLYLEEKSIKDEFKKYASVHVGDLRKLVDYFSILKERVQAFVCGSFTESAVVMSFWIPALDLPGMEKQLLSLGVCELVTLDPSKDDDVPSFIRNKPLYNPYTVLTKLYSLPKYGAVDPTPKLAPFFFIFFGMCLGDAGYAVIMAVMLLFVFRKFKKIPENIMDFFKIFLFVSLSTLVYGTITGSFFGDLFAVVPFLKPLDNVRNALMMFDPMKDIMLVMGISLALGVIHLFYGMILAMRALWDEENYVDALFDKAAWLVFLSGILFIGAVYGGVVSRAWMGIAQGITVFGALVFMWHAGLEKKNIFSKIISGLLTLYGATSWLGDVLSYSRLLALGLASAAIASVINMLGGLVIDIPYVGWFFAIIVMVGGHIFNLVINVLGAFVHSLRLQYVEFFGKFYEGGGREFNPLSCKTKYVNLSE